MGWDNDNDNVFVVLIVSIVDVVIVVFIVVVVTITVVVVVVVVVVRLVKVRCQFRGQLELMSTYRGAGRWKHHLSSPSRPPLEVPVASCCVLAIIVIVC